MQNRKSTPGSGCGVQVEMFPGDRKAPEPPPPLLGPPLRCHGHRFSPRAAPRRVQVNLHLSRVPIGWIGHVTSSGMLIHGNRPQAPPPRATAEQPAGCAAESRGGGLRGGPGRARPGGGGARRPPQVTGGRVRAGAGWRRRGGARGTPGAVRRP